MTTPGADDDPRTAAARAMAHADMNRWHDEPAEGAFPAPLAAPGYWLRLADVALAAATGAGDYGGTAEVDVVARALAREQWNGRCIVGGVDVTLSDPFFEKRVESCRGRARDLLLNLDKVRPPGKITGDPEQARAAGQRIVDACIAAEVDGRAAEVGRDIDGEDLGICAVAVGGRP